MSRQIRNNRSMRNSRNDKTPPIGVYLFIPYFNDDDGTRPLPSGMPFYLCSSILVNGAPYMGEPLAKGQNINLAVKVKNIGAKAARNTIVRIYWENPTIGFLRAQVANHLIAQVQIPALSTGEVIISPETPWTITEDIPEHVCLLAEVDTALDPAPAEIDVVHDRHFAQQNLSVLTVKPGMKVFFPMKIVSLANMGDALIQVKPVDRSILKRLSTRIKAEPAQTLVKDAQLLSQDGIPISKRLQLNEPDSSAVITCDLAFTIPENIHPGQFVAIEVTMSKEKEPETPIGGLMVIAIAI